MHQRAFILAFRFKDDLPRRFRQRCMHVQLVIQTSMKRFLKLGANLPRVIVNEFFYEIENEISFKSQEYPNREFFNLKKICFKQLTGKLK